MANENEKKGNGAEDSLFEKAGELVTLLGRRAKRELKEGIKESREKIGSLLDDLITELKEDEKPKEDKKEPIITTPPASTTSTQV